MKNPAAHTDTTLQAGELTHMEAGWYLNGGRAWYWNGSKFTDWVDENAYQMSYCEWDEEQLEANREELEEATDQVGDIFINLAGPYEFEEICDGKTLLDPEG